MNTYYGMGSILVPPRREYTVPARRGSALVADGDPRIVRYLGRLLARQNYVVWTAETAAKALECARERTPELVILDAGLGLDVCRRLRTWSAAPVMMLAAETGWRARTEALESGADDCLSKPFSAGELQARLRALTRRTARPAGAMSTVRVGALLVDLTRRRVSYRGRPVPLTCTEFEILGCLAARPGWVVSITDIVRQVWGGPHHSLAASLRVHIAHLRRKLRGPGLIEAVAGVGYRLAAPDGSSQ